MLIPHSGNESVVISYGIVAANVQKKSVTQSKVSDFFISKAVFGSVDKPWGRGIKMKAPFPVSVYGKGAFT